MSGRSKSDLTGHLLLGIVADVHQEQLRDGPVDAAATSEFTKVSYPVPTPVR